MIPKKIHMMWLPDISQAPDDQRESPKRWGDLNPGYEIVQWDDESLGAHIEENHEWLFEIWNNLDVVVKRADLSRLLVLHDFGGIYMDMDMIPQRPIESFLADGCIYNKFNSGKQIPDIASEDLCNFRHAKTILNREEIPIDRVGVGIANGVMMAEPGQDWIMEFLIAQRRAFRGLVLDYLGTWALTRFLRPRGKEMWESGDLIILPPHYFLWDEGYYTSDMPDYTVSVHPKGSSWYDIESPAGFRI